MKLEALELATADAMHTMLHEGGEEEEGEAGEAGDDHASAVVSALPQRGKELAQALMHTSNLAV
jgi:hypothetical protein